LASSIKYLEDLEYKMGDEDFEIKEPDEYSHKAGESFSHSQLIMLAMRKCIEAGCKEMRAGYYNEKRDKFGNNMITYNPDTRKELIESVETLLMVMADDIDTEAEKIITELQKDIKSKYNDYCKREEEDWKTAPHPLINQWQKQGIFFRKGMLNEKFPYAVEFIMEKVIASRKIFAELKKLTQRKDYYREEMYTA
jgi:hypothetical protein